MKLLQILWNIDCISTQQIFPLILFYNFYLQVKTGMIRFNLTKLVKTSVVKKYLYLQVCKHKFLYFSLDCTSASLNTSGFCSSVAKSSHQKCYFNFCFVMLQQFIGRKTEAAMNHKNSGTHVRNCRRALTSMTQLLVTWWLQI